MLTRTIAALALCFAFVPSIASAEDVGAVVAALPNEGAECRYIDGLATIALRASGSWIASMRTIMSNRSSGIVGAPQVDAINAERTGMMVAIRMRGDFNDASRIVAAKHGKAPRCLDKPTADLGAAQLREREQIQALTASLHAQ